jgi:hypothetical protein
VSPHVLVGIATPGAPCGNIYVSEALIAQKGEAYVRTMVRRTFEAAYRKQREQRARKARP